MGNSEQSGNRSQSHDLFRKVCLAIGLCVAVSAEAATQTVTYSVAGVQTAVTDTSSSFVGVAFGTDGDLAWWLADVERTPLDPQPAFITGGTFQLDGHLRDVVGTFSDGGLIIREPTSSCRKETFAVVGVLDLEGGVGEGFFDLTLTHYRLRVGAQCITYFATVEGLVAFTFASNVDAR
jgi:hypothetical protein